MNRYSHITLHHSSFQFISTRILQPTQTSDVFYLYQDFFIDQILCDGREVTFHEEQHSVLFRPHAKEIRLNVSNFHQLEVKYHGTINKGFDLYNNCVSEDLILLTDYAPWFPTLKMK